MSYQNLFILQTSLAAASELFYYCPRFIHQQAKCRILHPFPHIQAMKFTTMSSWYSPSNFIRYWTYSIAEKGHSFCFVHRQKAKTHTHRNFHSNHILFSRIKHQANFEMRQKKPSHPIYWWIMKMCNENFTYLIDWMKQHHWIYSCLIVSLAIYFTVSLY